MCTLFIPAAILSCLILFISPIYSAGFSIYEQGATALSMAGAFSAKADDATAIFYNPAGISQIEGTEISLGLSLIPPKSELQDPWGGNWETEDQDFWVPNLYIAHKLNDSISLGLGITAPFGLGMDWSGKDDFIYRYLIKDIALETMFVTPVISYKLTDNWSVAAGAMYVRSDVEYLAAVDMSAVEEALTAALGFDVYLDDSEMKLEGDNEDGDWGFTLGIHGQMDRVHVGLAYRSAVECMYAGDADFTVPASLYGPDVDAIIASYFPDTSGDTKIELPASLQVGIGFDFTEKLYAEFDVLWHQWSTYDSLDIDFGAETLPDISQKKDWDDVMSYRFGLQYKATEQLALSCGYYFDESPVPDETLDPILPDADRHSFQVGASYDFGGFKVAGTYMNLMSEDRGTTTNYRGINGDYESQTHIFSAQLSYSF